MQTLRDVMTPDPVSVEADSTVRVALEELERGIFRHLPVMAGDKVVGMLSDRDVAPWRRALRDVREGETGLCEEILLRPVKSFMRTDVLFLDAGRPVTDAIDVMLDFKVGAVPIVVDHDRLVGIVSYVDLLELLRKLL